MWDLPATTSEMRPLGQLQKKNSFPWCSIYVFLLATYFQTTSASKGVEGGKFYIDIYVLAVVKK